MRLAGDAGNIVPPTGNKGFNLAASDVLYAAEALVQFFTANEADAVANYSDKALARVWKAERFSWSLTRLMHRFPDDDPFERAMQVAELTASPPAELPGPASPRITSGCRCETNRPTDRAPPHSSTRVHLR